jgi:chitinase
LDYYAKNGFLTRQLNMGIPFYGQSYTLTSGSNTGLNAPTSSAGQPGSFSLQQGMMTYFEICQQGKCLCNIKIDPRPPHEAC